MKIGNRIISTSQKPYIIAELSANHGGEIENAKRSIVAAKKSGADAIKIQTYTPDTMTINCSKKDFEITEGLWKDYNLYQLYEEAFTPYEWHEELFKFAHSLNITIFSTPFDESAVDLLESINTPAYKVASFELTDIPLIKYIAEKKKPMLISTGMATLEEISSAVESIRMTGNNDILLFHCISSYPALTSDSNLHNIKFLKKEFNVEVGLSDHTISNTASITAIALGASAIEKHFKVDDEIISADSSFSINSNQLDSLVKETNESWFSLGSEGFHRSKSEKDNLKYRRSIYFIKDLKAGDKIDKGNIKRIRPGFGLSPKYFDQVLGKKLTTDVERGDPVLWELLE